MRFPFPSGIAGFLIGGSMALSAIGGMYGVYAQKKYVDQVKEMRKNAIGPIEIKGVGKIASLVTFHDRTGVRRKLFMGHSEKEVMEFVLEEPIRPNTLMYTSPAPTENIANSYPINASSF